ncbi:MAG: hypothetical protein Q8Q33_01715, partial [Chlamydiota bacterium]|nr:hypothetical protein [Chlamydiota bacterium]
MATGVAKGLAGTDEAKQGLRERIQTRVRSLLNQLSAGGILSPVWVDENGEVQGSRVFYKMLDRFFDLSGRAQKYDRSSRMRDHLFHEYAHQVIRDNVSEAAKRQMAPIMDPDHAFAKAFVARYGTLDEEEVLAKFASYTFTGADADLFKMDADGVLSVSDMLGDMGLMAQVEVPMIAVEEGQERAANKALTALSTLRDGQDLIEAKDSQEALEWLVNALSRLSPDLQSRSSAKTPKMILKDLLIEYRMLQRQGMKEDAMGPYAPVSAILSEMLSRTDEDGMPVTLWSMLGAEKGKGNKEQIQRLKNLSAQVHTRINFRAQHRADAEVRRAALNNSSTLLRAWDRVRALFIYTGTQGDRNVFVLDIKTLVDKVDMKDGRLRLLGKGLGFDQVVEELFSLKPGTRVMLMRGEYTETQVLEILAALGINPDRIGQGADRVQIVEDWTKDGRFEDILREALGVKVLDKAARKQARRSVVAILSEETQSALSDIGQFRQEMKIVVGNIGTQESSVSLVPEVMGLAMVLGSVDEAYGEDKKLIPELGGKLKTYLLEIAAEVLKDESPEERERLVSSMVAEIQEDGFFKLPDWKDDFDQMMQQLLIEDNFIDVAA